jgi:6-pyruvoyltetrahydropterin/6-carboxytetrahydropterin synthase
MFRLGLERVFEARHFLIGGDWGQENAEHAHRYSLRWVLSGPGLDGHGFLADIDDLNRILDRVLDGYRDRLLNQLPGFEGQNPSLERFVRLIARELSAVDRTGLATEAVRLGESDSAWAEWEPDDRG